MFKTSIQFPWLVTGRCRLTLGLALLSGPGPSAGARENTDDPVTSAAAVRTMSQMERLSNRPVRLEGLVLARFRDRGRFFLHQAGAGVVVISPRGQRDVPFGARMRVEGTTTGDAKSHVVASNLVVIARDAVLPTAKRVRLAELQELSPYDEWLEVSAFVQSVRNSAGGMQMWLRENGVRIMVNAPRPPPEEFRKLRLARVTLRGILATAGLHGAPSDGRRLLWVNQLSDLSVKAFWPGDPFDVPRLSVKELRATNSTWRIDDPVRLRAWYRFADPDRKELIVADDTGEIRVANAWGRLLRPDEPIEFLGFRESVNGSSRLDASDLRWLGQPVDGGSTNQPLKEWLPVVAGVGNLRGLSRDQLMQGLPARVLGVVTYRDENAGVFQVQQSSWNGVRVRWTGTNAIPAAGTRLVVSGHTVDAAGEPEIVHRNTLIIRESRLPEPVTLPIGGVVQGRYLGAWARAEGVVRSVTWDKTEARIRFQWQQEILPAKVPLYGNDAPATNLVDAVIRMTGVLGAVPGRMFGERLPVLLVSSTNDFALVDPAPNDPFSAPAVSIGHVLERNRTDSRGRRLRVDGVVTDVRPTESTIDDGTNGLALRLATEFMPKVGERVAVLGFPEPGELAPLLADVVIRRLGEGSLPPAQRLAADKVLFSPVNNRRIRVKGTLMGQAPGIRGHTLVLREGSQSFTANLLPGAQESATRWENGSSLEVTGVCRFQAEAGGDPETFRLLVEGPGAVAVLSAPSWWTAERAVAVVSGTGLLAALALGWAMLLRRHAAVSRQQFLTTFDASPLPAWIVNRRTQRLVSVNREFVRLFGYSREEAVGRSVEDFNVWDSNRKRRRFLAYLDDHERVSSYEAQLRNRSGQLVQALLAAEPIQVGDDECRLIIAYDVTERLKLLEQLRQSQKMEAVGQLAAGVAHDFNNLLTVIRGNSELMRQNRGLDQDTRTLNEEVDHAASRAAELTRQLLAFSRRQVMRRRPVELRQLVEHSTGMLGRLLGETITVVCRTGGEPLPIRADSGMLDQVILNLAVNARDAMPNGGQLVISTRRVSYSRSDLPANPDAKPGDFAVLGLADTGEGMGEDVRRHAFDPFFTTKDVGRGTGLGLSTVYGIVSQHGGWIDLESVPGKGTTFSVHLPISIGESDSDSRELPSAEACRGTETLMVVEDEEPVRKLVRRTLTHHGYRVLEAADGPAAEAILQEHGERIDLMLTDIVMPNGLSGLELAERLRGRQPDLKVIYMTGYSEKLVEYGGALTAGFDFLPKPFERQELVRLVRERLDTN